jgi:hypothetical protein
MKVFSGTVQNGRIVVEGEPLREGEKVTILAREGRETFVVSAEEKRLLLESIGQADRGEFVDGEELLRELDETN